MTQTHTHMLNVCNCEFDFEVANHVGQVKRDTQVLGVIVIRVTMRLFQAVNHTLIVFTLYWDVLMLTDLIITLMG